MIGHTWQEVVGWGGGGVGWGSGAAASCWETKTKCETRSQSRKVSNAALRKSVCFGLHVHARVSASVFPRRRRTRRVVAPLHTLRAAGRGWGRGEAGGGGGGRGEKLAGTEQDAGTEASLLSRLGLIPTDGVRHVHPPTLRFSSSSLYFLLFLFLLLSPILFLFLLSSSQPCGFALMSSYIYICCLLLFHIHPGFLLVCFPPLFTSSSKDFSSETDCQGKLLPSNKQNYCLKKTKKSQNYKILLKDGDER